MHYALLFGSEHANAWYTSCKSSAQVDRPLNTKRMYIHTGIQSFIFVPSTPHQILIVFAPVFCTKKTVAGALRRDCGLMIFRRGAILRTYTEYQSDRTG